VTDVGPQLTSRYVGKVTIITDRWACIGAVERPHPFHDQPRTVVSLDANGALAYTPTATPLVRPACPAESGAICGRCSGLVGVHHWQALDATGTLLCINCLAGLLRQGLAELTDDARQKLSDYLAAEGTDTTVYDVHHAGRALGQAREVLRVDGGEWGAPLRDPLARALRAVARGPEGERKAVAELLTLILSDASPKGRKP